jgi:DnaJ-class molecular chaperone
MKEKNQQKCTTCNGKGHVSNNTVVKLNWPVAEVVIGFFFRTRVYEKRKGAVVSQVTCGVCNGTGIKP